MKALKIINNRLNWISVGVTIGFMVFAWMQTEEDKKKKADPFNFSNYQHNYNKENTNA